MRVQIFKKLGSGDTQELAGGVRQPEPLYPDVQLYVQLPGIALYVQL